MLRIHSLRQTTWQHPSQWEAITDDGRPVYIRYKWGELQVYVGPVGGDRWEKPAVFDADVGDRHDSQIDWSGVVEATGIEVVEAATSK